MDSILSATFSQELAHSAISRKAERHPSSPAGFSGRGENKPAKRSGFTAVETLLTIGIIAVTSGIIAPLYRSYVVRSDLGIAVEQTMQALSRSQILSRSGLENATWGFAVAEGVLFSGDGYPVRDVEFDESYPLPKSIRVSGLTEVTFQRVTGIPNQTGDIIFTSNWSLEQRILTVSADGTVVASGLIPPPITPENIIDSDLHNASEAASASSASSAIACNVNACAGGAPGGLPVSCNDGTFSGAICVQIADGVCGWTWRDCPSTIPFSPISSSSAGMEQSTAISSFSAYYALASSSLGGAGISSQVSSVAGSSQGYVESGLLCGESFHLWNDGTIELSETVDTSVEVLGSAFTFMNGNFVTNFFAAAGGGNSMITVSVSTDGGHVWASLFQGDSLARGQTDTIANLPSGTQIVFRVNGRQGWLFGKSFKSNDHLGHILLLRNGDSLPDVDAMQNRAALPASLRAHLDSSGKIAIDEDQVLLLAEIGGLSKSSADFNDAMLLIRFAVKPGSCVAVDDPKFSVNFERVENISGDLGRSTYVGNKGIVFADGQWIPLATAGVDNIDFAPLLEAVPGFAAERLAGGTVRVLLHGSHLMGKEIADARIVFAGATITGIENDTGIHQLENPFDGIVNDGVGGDEATLASDHQSVLLQSRVMGEDDALLIHWQRSLSGNSSSAGSAVAADGAEPDACAAAFIRDSRGRIVLQEKADVRFSILGSHALFGTTGNSAHIRLRASVDGGISWRYLFSYFDIVSGDQETLRDVPAQSVITLDAEERFATLFKKTAQLGDIEGRIRAFLPGETLPSIGLLTSPSQLQSFLSSMLENGKVKHLPQRSLLLLVELQSLDGTADFQDAVVLVDITKPISAGGSCAAAVTESSSSSSSLAVGSAASLPSASSILICHFPPSNPSQTEDLRIETSSWATHAAHGDHRGACAGDDDGDGVTNAVDLCPGTYMPEGTPTESMLEGRYAVTGVSNVFTTGPRNRTSPYTLRDTYGCTCEQLIDVAESKTMYYFGQHPSLLQQLRGLFPYYTQGAQQYGCGKTLLELFGIL
ncbi:MAG: hypothetical protein WCG83_00490 [Candidatus Peregrinibacteria bacterium]